MATALGEYDEAQRLFEQGLAMTRQSGNRRGMALTLTRLSEVYRLMGDLDLAERYCCESEEICQELGYRKGAILAQISRGDVALAREDYQAAHQDFQQSLAASEHIGFARGTISSLIGLGRSAHGQGEFVEAESYLRRALTMAASASHLPRAALSALAALAKTLVAEDELIIGVELLALAANQPLADRYTKDNANQELERLRAQMNPAQFDSLVEHGRSQNLETILKGRLDSAT